MVVVVVVVGVGVGVGVVVVLVVVALALALALALLVPICPSVHESPHAGQRLPTMAQYYKPDFNRSISWVLCIGRKPCIGCRVEAWDYTGRFLH